MLLPAETADAGSRMSRDASAGWLVHGRRTSKRVPSPGLLMTSMVPPWSRTIPWTAARPMPRPVNLVVKKGSKILTQGFFVHAAAGIADHQTDVIHLDGV